MPLDRSSSAPMEVPLKDTHSTTFCQEIKPPLQEHKQAIGKSNEKVNMHDCPDYPRCETRKPAEAQVGDGVCSADDREITLIPIPERFRLSTPRHTAPNDVRNVLTFLYSGLSYSGHEHWGS